ncbi:SMC5-SMC6 complex localization factor protein 1 [Gadus macrocephalus]|uniref:SMC5-SMC6 complex localization factor protein 1 n=1 Tax=Gadus macrocephalus TaxID=80720 RepID=UPI0028CB2096|nr:SMC5-SMC6 complex localization factor protein 1 [Gadus macrocephalus]
MLNAIAEFKMASSKRVIQISGIKNRTQKQKVVEGIRSLGGKYIGGSVYQQDITHLIVSGFSQSEKFLAACAAGKWVLTQTYVFDSVQRGSWLPEEPYEVALSQSTQPAHNPVRQWRKRVADGSLPGAFHGWTVLLVVADPLSRAIFKRLLKAGKAEVYLSTPPPPHAAITHVLAKPLPEDLQGQIAPCYPVKHVVHHLFGGHFVDLQGTFEASEELPAEAEPALIEFCQLEKELKEYIIKREEQPRLLFPEFQSYHEPYSLNSKAVEADFSNVGSMIESGLFSEALDSIRDTLSPGLLPPAVFLVSLLEHALQGNASAVYLRNLQQVLHGLLLNNPSWLFPHTVKKYFSELLQCPQCKRGLWPFIETIISSRLSSDAACHPLPGPASPSLLCLHGNLLALVLKLFQGELHSVTARDSGLLKGAGVSRLPASGSLLYETFWTVWERSTLLSMAVKQLVKLLVQVLIWEKEVEDEAEREARQELRMGETLLDMLAAMVEFWCQQHLKLNQTLVEMGLKDLGEHLAVSASSQDIPLCLLVELVARIPSSRLRLVTADAVFRNLCCRNGVTVSEEPLSLKKMVSSYLPALERLVEGPRWADNRGPCPAPEPVSHSWTSPQRIQSSSINETSPGKEFIPKGLNRVNAAGETCLHRACKRNQVETVRHILSLPGVDVNVKGRREAFPKLGNLSVFFTAVDPRTCGNREGSTAAAAAWKCLSLSLRIPGFSQSHLVMLGTW